MTDIQDVAERMSPEDMALDVLWRDTFGEPLPMMGAADIVRTILRNHGVEVPRVLVKA
ncbi:MAG: hypothetical protein ACRED4_04490 [Brevundimonas sp.]